MSYTIPKTQTAAVVPTSGAAIEIRHDHPVCHTDLHAALGDWPLPAKTPLVGGHEGVGEIVAIGNNTSHSPVKIGDRVGVKWLADSCLNCEQCRKGREQNCLEAKLSGFTVDGTFQQYVVSYVNHVTLIPEGFDSNAAASILCAGVTVYRAIKYSQTSPGDWIVLPGAGGGLGHLAIQYAKVAGLQVIAVDTGADKKKLCLELGADKWIDFQESKDIVEEIKAITGGLGAHSALVTAASSSGYKQAIEYLRGGGTLMAVGLPGKASLEASIFFTVFKVRMDFELVEVQAAHNFIASIRASAFWDHTSATRQDATEAIAIAARGEVKCKFSLKSLDALSSVYEGLTKGGVAGRVVLEMPK
ncbi:PKS-ER domain-containing protein [Mycena venus]|uniref:alcohol dehydrogenase n=1 Tax=Mycena venus TaxID=2733690 RepID=A0A8H6WWX9_9AGAR|nr:PKS-ER domain-containing protein [Mycena venus]